MYNEIITILLLIMLYKTIKLINPLTIYGEAVPSKEHLKTNRLIG